MSRGKRFTAEQTIKILREVEIYSGQGKTITQGCHSCEITEQTFYRCSSNAPLGYLNVTGITGIKQRTQRLSITPCSFKYDGLYAHPFFFQRLRFEMDTL